MPPLLRKISYLFLLAAMLVFLLCNYCLWFQITDESFFHNSDNASYLATGSIILGKQEKLRDALDVNGRGFGFRPPIYSTFISLFEPSGVFPRDPKHAVQWQYAFFSLSVLALVCCISLHSPCWGIVVLAVITVDTSLCAMNSALRSHSIAHSFFFLALASATFAQTRKKQRMRQFGWFGCGTALAAMGLTRLQYQYTSLFLLPAFLFFLRQKSRRELLFTLLLIYLPIVVTSLSWDAYVDSHSAPSRKENSFTNIFAKAISPALYVGPKNTDAQNSIANIWNTNTRNGRPGNKFPVEASENYWNTYYQGPNDVVEKRRSFFNEVRPIILRSIQYNWTEILKNRLNGIIRYLQKEKPKRHRFSPHELKQITRKTLKEAMTEGGWRLAVMNAQGQLGSHHFSWFYHLHVAVALFVALVLPFIALRKQFNKAVALPLFIVSFIGAFILGDLFSVGFAYNNAKNAYKVLAFSPLWIANIIMIGCFVSLGVRKIGDVWNNRLRHPPSKG